MSSHFHKKKHRFVSYCRCVPGSKGNVLGSVRSVYDITEGSADPGTQCSSVRICVAWQRPRSVLEKPAADAQAVLRVTVVPGDRRMSGPYALWSELTCLKAFSAGLDNEGVVWRRAGDDEATVQEDLLDLLETIKQRGPRPLVNVYSLFPIIIFNLYYVAAFIERLSEAPGHQRRLGGRGKDGGACD